MSDTLITENLRPTPQQQRKNKQTKEKQQHAKTKQTKKLHISKIPLDLESTIF